MFQKQQKKLPPDWRILRRRAVEDRIETLNVSIAEQKGLSGFAHWENKNHARAQTQNIARLYEAHRTKAAEKLLDRRRKLAALLNAEDAALKTELDSAFESPDERRARLEERAMMLKNRREEARVKLVEQKLDQKFRASCDAYRQLRSLQKTAVAVSGLQQQVDDKNKEAERLAKLDADYDSLWLADISRKKAREDEERAYRANQNALNKNTLDRQVIEKINAKESLRRLKETADQEDLKQWAKEHRDALKKREVEMKEKEIRLQKIVENNKARLGEMKRERQAERARDQYLLKNQMEKEAKQIEAEEQKKRAYRDAARDYQEQLRILMVKEAESQDEMNRYLAQAEEERWAKRERQWTREAKARSDLMAEVMTTRERQIEDKKKNLERERLEDKKMYEAMYKEHLMKEDAEKAKQQQRRSTAYEGRKLLEQQIDMKARVRRAEKQAVLLEHRTMLKEERRYMSKVNSLLAEERKAMERLKR